MTRETGNELPGFTLPDFGLMGAELDFDLSDFDIIGEADPREKPEPQGRILKPRIDKREILKKVKYENAELFATQVDLRPGARTFAWVSGSFVFGDIIEALMFKRGIDPAELYVCTLSLSQDNVDSLYNCLMFGNIRRFTLLISAYYYSHERYGMIPYIYKKLDAPEIRAKCRVQIAFGHFHCKIIAMKTHHGHTLTCHGSANLRSSNSIEQIMLEQGEDLYNFNREIFETLAETYGTLNYKQMVKGDTTWQAVLSVSVASEADSSQVHQE